MKVLIAIDDSQCSTAALDSVAGRVWAPSAEFRLITVLEPIIAMYGYAGAYAINSVTEAERELTERSQNLIGAKVSQLKAVFKNDSVSGEILWGDPANSIIDDAKTWGADLLVVGDHGRRGMQRFLQGSVSEKVASHAECSVEIIKEKIVRDKSVEMSGSLSSYSATFP